MKNASIFFIKGTRALVDHAAAAALISGAGRRSWPQHGPGAARHLIRRNGQGFPRPFSWRPVSGPHRGPEAARSRAGLICAAAATVQGALASRMQDGHVVVKIQCSLIPCRGRQAPVIQRGRVRASIAFMYPRPRKHRLCIHTPACLGYALKPYALREQHEDRARGARDTIARYNNMEIVATEYDMDSVDLAYDLTMKILADCPDLDGIICCNMSNPVGAARAITETESSTVIVGMDHDQEALRYLDEGVIYCLGVQDCFSIGFDTLQVAVKIADGNLPGALFPEKTNEITTVIYQKDAALMLELLYGDIA